MGLLVALYGSHARGDTDPSSDRDLIQLGFDARRPAAVQQPEDSTVTYSWREFSGMSAYGSLFLRHLSKESIILSSSHEDAALYWNILSNLPPYQRVARDLIAFNQAVSDSISAVADGHEDDGFELSNLATVARHSAILGCYLLGMDCYSRSGAVQRFCDARNLHAFPTQFDHYYKYRLAFARGFPLPGTASKSDVLDWASQVRYFLKEVEDAADL